MTQPQLNEAVNSIVARQGQRIGFPDGRYFGECTAPIAWYMQALNLPLPPMYNIRADGWGVQFPADLAPYFIHESYQLGKVYPYGSIMMWNSPHIAVVIHSDGSNIVNVIEQNADPEGAVVKVTNREINNSYHQANYVLMPIVQTEATVPYTVEDIPTKLIQLKRDANLWNMVYSDFASIAAHPINMYSEGYRESTAAICHHHCGQSYYMVGNNETTGFNVNDCQDYVPPSPPPAPPAAPVTVKLAETYKLVTNVMSFTSSISASQHSGLSKTVSAGTYYVWDTSGKTKLIGTSNVKRPDPETWVNTDDNVEVLATPPSITAAVEAAAKLIPPAPTIDNAQTVADQLAVKYEATSPDSTWKSMTPLRADRQAVKYISINLRTVLIQDFEHKGEDIPMTPYKEVWVAGTFIGPDGAKYYRTAGSATQYRWYGIPVTLLQKDSPFNYAKTLAERVATRTTKIGDAPARFAGKLHKIIDDIKATGRF